MAQTPGPNPSRMLPTSDADFSTPLGSVDDLTYEQINNRLPEIRSQVHENQATKASLENRNPKSEEDLLFLSLLEERITSDQLYYSQLESRAILIDPSRGFTSPTLRNGPNAVPTATPQAV